MGNTLNDLTEQTKEDVIEISKNIQDSKDSFIENTHYLADSSNYLLNQTNQKIIQGGKFLIQSLVNLAPINYEKYEFKRCGEWAKYFDNIIGMKNGHIFYWKGRIYLVGNLNKEFQVYCYNLSKHIWTLLQDIERPSIRIGHTIVQYHENLILWGGGYKTKYGEMDVFHLNSLQWATSVGIDSIPSREGHSACMYFNFMVIFGGYRVHHQKTYYNDINLLNVSNMQWSTISTKGELPHKRSDHMVCIKGHNMYIFGGCYHQDDVNIFFNDLWEYNFKLNQWREIKTNLAPIARIHSTMEISSGNNLYILGGWCQKGKILNDFWTFDIDRKLWIQLYTKNIPPARFTHHSTMDERDVMYIYGGSHWNEEEQHFEFLEDLHGIRCKKQEEWNTILVLSLYQNDINFSFYGQTLLIDFE